MGLSKNAFNSEVFKKLPWQTSALTNTFLSLASKKNISFNTLERLSDIDDLQDIKYLINNFRSLSKALTTLLLNSITTKEKAIYFTHLTFNSLSLSSYFNKGSPQLVM